jgi:hypothetical protein
MEDKMAKTSSTPTQASATVKMQMKPNKTVTRKKSPTLEEAAADAAPMAMTSEQREEMVRYAAYHIAEKDGFQAGRELDYWNQAQEQIDQLLNVIQSPSADQH